MQNNNSSDVSHFDLTVNAIKKEKSVKKKLNFFVKHMPVFFWQHKNLLEVLGPFGYVSFLKLLKMYRLEEVAIKAGLQYSHSYDVAKAFMNKLGLSKSEYAPFITIARDEKEERIIKNRMIKKNSPILSVFRLFFDDNNNEGAKLKLSDFGKLEKYEIAEGLCNLIVKEGIFESIKELKKYCNEDLNRVLVGVVILVMFMQKGKELESRKIPDVLKNALRRFLSYNDTDKGNDAKKDDDTKKMCLSDFNDLGKLSSYQINNGLYNLINSGLVSKFDELEKYFDESLVRTFFIAMLEAVSKSENYQNLVNLRYEGPEGELKTFFNILRESMEFIIDKKSGAKVGSSDFQGSSGKVVDIIYNLICKGVVKNFEELKKYFVDDLLVFGKVFLYLIYDDLESRFEHNRASDIAKTFAISGEVMQFIFDYYISVFTDNIALNYPPSFNNRDKFIARTVLKYAFDRNTCFVLPPYYMVRHIAVFIAGKSDLDLSEESKKMYKHLFDKVTPYNLVSTVGDPGKSWDNDTEHLRKLFVLLCSMGVWGFSIKSDLKSFSNDLKIDEKEIKNAFTKVLSKGKESDDFRNLYSLLTNCSFDSAFLTTLTSDMKLLRPVLLAMIETMDLKDMEEMLLACLGHKNSMCLQEGINECLSKISALDHHRKIKLILALIKTQQLALPGLNCHWQYKETICEALYGKNRIKLDTRLKRVFYEAFKIYIKDNSINGYELDQIVNYRKIIGLNKKQIDLILACGKCCKETINKLSLPPNIKEGKKELSHEPEKDDEISDDPKELVNYSVEGKELIGRAMREMNLRQLENTLIEHLGCLNSSGFYYMLKECASIDFIDKLSNDRKIISIIAFIKANQVLSTDEYSDKYGRHFRHGIYHFMYSDDRTKLKSGLKKVFDKAFGDYIKGDEVSSYELNKIIEYKDVIGFDSTQLRSILAKVLEIDDLKKNIPDLLIKAIKNAEKEEVRQENGKTILLNEEEEEKKDGNTNKEENRNNGENKTVSASLKSKLKDKRSINKEKSMSNAKPKMMNECENDKNGFENRFIGKKHDINKEK